MKLTPPKAVTFWISVLLVVLGAASTVIAIPFVSTYSLAVVLIGFVLLALGNMIKGF
jgi:hypothetical protein